MANLPKIRRSPDGGPQGAPAAVTEPAAPDVRRLEAHGLTWLNIESPSERETAWLAEHYEFHHLDLEDVLSRRRQRPKIDTYPDYLFIVLHFPRFDKRTGRLQPAELNIFVADGLVITLPNEPLKALSGLWSRVKRSEEARDQVMSKGSAYLLYEIVDTMYDYCFPILDKIGFKLDRIEDALFEEDAAEAMVRDISNAKQEIINYRKIVKPQRPTLGLLERSCQRYTPDDLELYFDDIVDKSERVWDLLENYKEVAEALEATNESVITHRMNDIIRVLTIMSAIVLPLSLIASIYGMNVDLLPFARSGAFSLVFPLVLMVGFAGALIWWFRHKRWL
ncbi:MAG TPA: magnesium transporter CorA family protein [Miltoncostaeaceae bacterium]|nr:magnesium transporter CorA family protein [Miltoncostaeaceae bacterium]